MQIIDYLPRNPRLAPSSKLLYGCALFALGGSLASLIPLSQKMSGAIHPYQKLSGAIHLDNGYSKKSNGSEVEQKTSTSPTKASTSSKRATTINLLDNHVQTERTLNGKKSTPSISRESEIGTNQTLLSKAQKVAKQTAITLGQVKSNITTTTHALDTDNAAASKAQTQETHLIAQNPSDQSSANKAKTQLDVANQLLQTTQANAAAALKKVQQIQAEQAAIEAPPLQYHKGADQDLAMIVQIQQKTGLLTKEGVGTAKIQAAQNQLNKLQQKVNQDNNQINQTNNALTQAKEQQSQAEATLKTYQQAVKNCQAGVAAAENQLKEAKSIYIRAQIEDNKRVAPSQNSNSDYVTFFGHRWKKSSSQSVSFIPAHSVVIDLGKSYSVQAAEANLQKAQSQLASAQKNLASETQSLSSTLSSTKTEINSDTKNLTLEQAQENKDAQALTTKENSSSLYQLVSAMNNIQGYGWNNWADTDIPLDLKEGKTLEQSGPGNSPSADFGIGYTGWSIQEESQSIQKIIGIDQSLGFSKSLMSQITKLGTELSPLDVQSNESTLNTAITAEVEGTIHPNETNVTYGPGLVGQFFQEEHLADEGVLAASKSYQAMQAPLAAAQEKLTTAQALVIKQQKIVESDEATYNQALNVLELNTKNTQLLGAQVAAFQEAAQQQQQSLEASKATLSQLEHQSVLAQEQVTTLQQHQNALMSTLNAALSKANRLHQQASDLKNSFQNAPDTQTLQAYNQTAEEINSLNELIFNLSGEKNENLPLLESSSLPVSPNENLMESMESQERSDDLEQRLMDEPFLDDPVFTSHP